MSSVQLDPVDYWRLRTVNAEIDALQMERRAIVAEQRLEMLDVDRRIALFTHDRMLLLDGLVKKHPDLDRTAIYAIDDATCTITRGAGGPGVSES